MHTLWHKVWTRLDKCVCVWFVCFFFSTARGSIPWLTWESCAACQAVSPVFCPSFSLADSLATRLLFLLPGTSYWSFYPKTCIEPSQYTFCTLIYTYLYGFTSWIINSVYFLQFHKIPFIKQQIIDTNSWWLTVCTCAYTMT